ncbi:thiamine phosphate synthase [Sphingobium sp. EM0848]|uniref:thiamine phosphate synthase n=1 Tax=Sphingobium sp. EM0848 TaxID=2743473 RepID=UPI00159BFB7D|nr:thiamine phosphate synthase [Sphingobium sp. EM0848]
MKPRHRKKLPAIWLLTDERVAKEALLAAARRLPKGEAGIVLRHYRTPTTERRALFDRLAAIARRRRLTLMLGGTAAQAAAWGAAGWHGRDGRRAMRPLLHSAPVHDAQELRAAERGRADFIFLSPLFPTRSHPGARTLGRVRFAALARRADMDVIALGGVRAVHRPMLTGIGASGWAAIDGLLIERR